LVDSVYGFTNNKVLLLFHSGLSLNRSVVGPAPLSATSVPPPVSASSVPPAPPVSATSVPPVRVDAPAPARVVKTDRMASKKPVEERALASRHEDSKAIRDRKKEEKLKAKRGQMDDTRKEANRVLFLAEQQKPSPDSLAYETDGTPVVDLRGNQLSKQQLNEMVEQYAAQEQVSTEKAFEHVKKHTIQSFVDYVLGRDLAAMEDSL